VNAHTLGDFVRFVTMASANSCTQSLACDPPFVWIESIVGRDWEVFWQRDTGGQEVAVGVPSSASLVNEPTRQFYDASFDTDKLNLGLKKLDGGRVVVHSVGQNALNKSINEGDFLYAINKHVISSHVLSLADIVARLVSAPRPVVLTFEQPSALANSSAVPCNDDSDSDEETLHETGWYEARVVSFLRQEESGKLIFTISFVGDEELSELPLSPTLVRPSATAWIKRTRALLEANAGYVMADQRKGHSDAPVFAVEEWETSLPADTRTLDDLETLASIQYTVTTKDFVYPPGLYNFNSPDPMLSVGQLDAIRRLLVLIRSQIYLRHQLVEVDEGTEPDAETVSNEKYVEFLAECLCDVEACCVWYYECWRLYVRIFGAPQQVFQEKLVADIVIKERLDGARRSLITLNHTMDLTQSAVTATRRKRTVSDVCVTVEGRRTRQRTTETFDLKGDVAMLLATATTKLLLEHVEGADQRWFAKYLGIMIKSLSVYVLQPLKTWLLRACSIGTDSSLTMDVHSILEVPLEEGAAINDYAHVKCNSEGYVTCDDIHAAVRATNYDAVLLHFDLVAYVDMLKKKLSFIVAFAQRAGNILARVLEEPTDELRSDDDPITSELIQLLEEANTKESPISNVEPIGYGAACVTRKVLENAILYRSWLLDLIQSESTRVQAAFLYSVFGRYGELKPLIFEPSSVADMLMSKLKNLAPRVQIAIGKHITNAETFNRYRSRLNQRGPGDTNDTPLFTLDGVSAALVELRSFPVVSIEEERLAVRKDILIWQLMASAVLEEGKRLHFDELLRIKENMDMILSGHPPTRRMLLTSVRGLASVDAELCELAKNDLVFVCGSVASRASSLYEASKNWKERSDVVLDSLRAHGNTLAGNKHETNKLPALVDFKQIKGLIDEYRHLHVNLDDTYSIIACIYRATTEWRSSITDFLLKESNSFEASLDAVTGSISERPKGNYCSW
jgi:hypothetical protein